MSVDVVTFGCRLNAAESEVIRREAERAGFADTVVVNTCAVTAEAVRQARQTDPRAAPRPAAGEDRRHGMRGADRAADVSSPWPKPTASSATPKSFPRRLGAGARRVRRRRRAEGDRQRHHGGAGKARRI